MDLNLGMIEIAHGLPPGLLNAMIEQESGGDEWASRYEPGFFSRYIGLRPQLDLGGYWPKGDEDLTERVHRSTSWGPMQVMGQVAREMGFAGRYLNQLSTPALGVEYGARKIAALLKQYEGDLSRALEAYNDGNGRDETESTIENYVEPILRRMGRR